MDVRTSIRRYLAESVLYSEDFPYADSESLIQRGVIDSLGVMELVSFVQGRFALQVGAREVTPDNFDSVDKLVSYVERKLRAREVDRLEPTTAERP